MKKFIAMLMALAIAFVATFALANSAGATGGGTPSPDNNKKVTLCHYDGSNENGGSGKYSKITVSINAFYTAGHIDHVNDIYEGFSWTDKDGNVHTVPSNGDTTLLAFDKCEKPEVDTELVVPASNYADPCGTENDVFTVAPGTGYTVGNVVQNPNGTQSITVTVLDGFVFPGDKDSVTITKPGFTNASCDLPETGSATTHAFEGLAVLALVGILGLFLLRRRNIV